MHSDTRPQSSQFEQLYAGQTSFLLRCSSGSSTLYLDAYFGRDYIYIYSANHILHVLGEGILAAPGVYPEHDAPGFVAMIAMMPVRQRVIALIATLIAACLLSERTHAWVVSPAYIKAGIQRASTHSSTSSSRTSCIIKRGGHVQARWQGARDTAGGASASNRGYFST